MNKKLRYSLLMLLLAVFSGTWAQDDEPEVEYDFSSGWTVNTQNHTITKDGVTMQAYGDTKCQQNSGYFILGKSGAYLTLPEFDFNVEKIVIVGSGGASDAVHQNIFVGDVAVSTETTGAKGTNTYEIASDYQDAGVFTLKVTSNHNTQISAIKVYKAGSSSNLDPIAEITQLSPLELNVGDEGTFTLTATIVDGESYSTSYLSGNTNVLTVDDDGNYVAIAAGQSKVTVTITPDDTENYKSSKKEFTVTVKAGTLENIAALTEQTSAGTYDVVLDNAVVTYTNGNYAYIQDESGAVLYYKSNHGLSAGQVFNGTATVTYQLRNSNPQITAISGVTAEAGTTTPEPTEVAADDFPTLNTVLSQWFKVTGATITKTGTKYYMDLNGQNVQLYGQGAAQNFSLTNLDGVTYTVIGFPTLYNTTLELQIFEVPEMEAGDLPFVGTINALEPLELTVGDEGEFTVDFTPYDGLTEGSDYHIYCNSDDLDIIWTASAAKVYEAQAPGTVTVTVTVEPTDDESYTAVTKDFTVTVKGAPYENIAALTEQNTAGTYEVVLDNAVVTYTNGSYAYIQDESGAVVMYKNGHGLTAGQVLNGTATVTYQLRNNNPQITALTGVTPEAGTTTPEPTEVAAEDFPTFLTVLSQWFKVTDATLKIIDGKYYVVLAGNEVQLYGQGDARNFTLDANLFDDESGESLNTFTVVGFPTLYNSVWELQIFEVPEAVGVPVEIMTDVTLEPTLVTVGDADVFTVTGELAEGAQTPIYSYTSSDETILTVTEEGEYEALAEGTVAVTVTVTPQESDAESFSEVSREFIITVIPAPGFYYKKVTATDDITDGRYLIVYEAENKAFDGSLETLDATFNTQDVTISADHIIATDVPMYFTFDTTLGSITSASGHVIGSARYENGLKQDKKVNNGVNSFSIDDEGNAIIAITFDEGDVILNFNSNKSDKRFRYYKGGSQKAIQIYKEMTGDEVPPVANITVGERGAVSFSSPFALDFTDADVQAYIVTEKNGKYFNKIEVTQVPANTGVVVEGAAGDHEVALAETMPEALEDNLLVATSTGAYTVEEADYGRAYGLFYSTTKNSVGFKKMSLGKTIDVNKCYLLLPEASGAEEIFFTIDGIDNIEQTAPVFEGTAYNLNGQKVNASYKGVIIVNGKKVINK